MLMAVKLMGSVSVLEIRTQRMLASSVILILTPRDGPVAMAALRMENAISELQPACILVILYYHDNLLEDKKNYGNELQSHFLPLYTSVILICKIVCLDFM